MKFYTSDLHFDDKNILHLCNRPYSSVDEMNTILKQNWNSRIKPEDHVYILGDICMNEQGFIDHMNDLNGFKHIVRGNHDPKNIQNKKMKNTHFTELIHTVRDGDAKIVLCHFPIMEWNGYYNGVYHFYGHLHGSRKSHNANAFEVGVDCQNYMPKTFDEIVNNK